MLEVQRGADPYECAVMRPVPVRRTELFPVTSQTTPRLDAWEA
jgi:hypothetical protein